MWRRVPVTQQACRRNGRTENSRKRLAMHKEEDKEEAKEEAKEAAV